MIEPVPLGQGEEIAMPIEYIRISLPLRRPAKGLGQGPDRTCEGKDGEQAETEDTASEEQQQ